MATLNKMTGFKVYKGTKETFISSGKATTYADAVVFITGGDGNAKNSCIFAQGTYFASIQQMMEAINFVKGINVGGVSYNAAANGGYVAFEASDPATVAVSASSNGISVGLTTAFVNKVNNTASALGSSSDAASASGSAFARIAAVAKAVSDLTADGEGSIADQLAALRAEIVGTLGTGDATTLAAINDELDAIDAKWASYVLKSDLSTEVSKNGGTKVAVTVKTKDGKVSGVSVDETALNSALSAKANASSVYTKTEADSMAQSKVNALANSSVKENTEAIATLKGNASVEGSIDHKIQVAINAFAGSADSDKVIENVTELLNYVAGVDGSKDLASAIAQIAENKGKIATLNGNASTAGSVAKAVADEKARAEEAYAVKATETTAASALSRANDAYTLAGQKATAVEAKAQAVAAISEIAEKSVSDSDNTYVKATVKTKAGSVSSVVIDDSGVKTYADKVAATAKSGAIASTTESLKSYYTKAEVDAMWMWEEL